MKFFIITSISHASGLILLLIENHPKTKHLFAGLPTIEVDNSMRKSYFQLLSRLLLIGKIFLFVNEIFIYDYTVYNVLSNSIGVIFVFFLIIGYKTKLSALVVIFILVIVGLVDFFTTQWRFVSANYCLYFIYCYSQVFSTIGCLLYVVALGPGDVSFDRRKKS